MLVTEAILAAYRLLTIHRISIKRNQAMFLKANFFFVLPLCNFNVDRLYICKPCVWFIADSM